MDLRDLHIQTKLAHWNVKGLQFQSLHELFDVLAGHVDGFVDLMAERVTALGGQALGTTQMIASSSRLPKYPLELRDGKDHLAALADRFGLCANHVRAAIDKSSELGDQDTADLFTEVSRQLDKDLWFLEAHLQG